MGGAKLPVPPTSAWQQHFFQHPYSCLQEMMALISTPQHDCTASSAHHCFTRQFHRLTPRMIYCQETDWGEKRVCRRWMEDAREKDGGGGLKGVLPAGENRLLWTPSSYKQENENATDVVYMRKLVTCIFTGRYVGYIWHGKSSSMILLLKTCRNIHQPR